jgi:hypothetical protein
MAAEMPSDASVDAVAATRDKPAKPTPNSLEQRRINSVEKRRSSERRRMIDPTTCDRDYTDEELAFMQAMDQYKRDNHRPYPTLSEVLEVLHSLGYRKVAEPTPLPGRRRNAAKG